MKFKLDFDYAPKALISDFSPIVLMGSCFAEYQSKNFESAGFKVLVNPFGIAYNPISISEQLQRIADGQQYSEVDFMQHNELYFSLEHHGSFKYKTIQEAISKSNATQNDSKAFLKKTELIIFTFGTSIVHEYIENSKVCANCHKLPNKLFKTRQLKLAECIEAFQNIVESLKNINPKLKIIASVSPVRHIKSGLIENNISKSTLRLALNEIAEMDYFPSYEIFIDELRDYRFSAEDLVHPNSMAQDYIWDKFKSTIFSNELQRNIGEIEKFRKFESHKALHNSQKHRDDVIELREKLQLKFPNAVL